jgi:hypothetical protein
LAQTLAQQMAHTSNMLAPFITHELISDFGMPKW